jgi:hypothetical protein
MLTVSIFLLTTLTAPVLVDPVLLAAPLCALAFVRFKHCYNLLVSESGSAQCKNADQGNCPPFWGKREAPVIP